MWRVLALLVLVPSLLLATDAAADGVTPVELTMLGPGAVRIRIAQGTTLPCDSVDNKMLVQGRFKPGEVVRTQVPDNCVCLQQTYEPFPDVDWAQASLVCRPQICTGVGRMKRCVPASDPTIRVGIRSKR